MGSEEGYNKESENNIKSDLHGNLDGNLEPLLVSILQYKRSENNNSNQNECQILA